MTAHRAIFGGVGQARRGRAHRRPVGVLGVARVSAYCATTSGARQLGAARSGVLLASALSSTSRDGCGVGGARALLHRAVAAPSGLRATVTRPAARRAVMRAGAAAGVEDRVDFLRATITRPRSVRVRSGAGLRVICQESPRTWAVAARRIRALRRRERWWCRTRCASGGAARSCHATSIRAHVLYRAAACAPPTSWPRRWRRPASCGPSSPRRRGSSRSWRPPAPEDWASASLHPCDRMPSILRGLCRIHPHAKGESMIDRMIRAARLENGLYERWSTTQPQRRRR